MKKGLIFTVSAGLLVIVLLSVIGLDGIDKQQLTEKVVLTDYGTLQKVDLVSSENYKTNFDFDLKKGNYSAKDTVYLIKENSTTLYSKYILTTEDSRFLKENDLNLYISFSGKVDQYQFNYLVVDAKDVASFEATYNTNDAAGNPRELRPKPLIKKVIGTGSLEDLEIITDEHDRNDEKLHITLMQSQLYTENTTIKIIDIKGEVLEELTLTDEMIAKLTKQNYILEYDVINIVDTIESNQGNKFMFIRIMEGEHTYSQYNLQINVTT